LLICDLDSSPKGTLGLIHVSVVTR